MTFFANPFVLLTNFSDADLSAIASNDSRRDLIRPKLETAMGGCPVDLHLAEREALSMATVNLDGNDRTSSVNVAFCALLLWIDTWYHRKSDFVCLSLPSIAIKVALRLKHLGDRQRASVSAAMLDDSIEWLIPPSAEKREMEIVWESIRGLFMLTHGLMSIAESQRQFLRQRSSFLKSRNWTRLALYQLDDYYDGGAAWQECCKALMKQDSGLSKAVDDLWKSVAPGTEWCEDE